MNVLITNAYSCRNKGDAAIILGMLRDLRSQKQFGDAEFCVSSRDPEVDSECYPCRVAPSFSAIANTVTDINLVNFLLFPAAVVPFSVLWLTLKRLLKVDLLLPARLRELLREYASADLIVAAGGGYLYSTSKWKGNVVLLMTLWSFFCGILLRKPVYLYSQSIGPFSGILQERLVRWMLGRVRMVQAREETTLELLHTWRLKTRVVSAVDAAFAVPAEDPPSVLPAAVPGRLRIGMTARRWFRADERQDLFEEVLAEFVRYLAEERCAEVWFVPQVVYADGHDDDRVCARSICARLRGNEHVHSIETEMSPAQTKGLCGQMDYFVGTRMHSNIFALSMNVPTLALGYQPKTKGIMEQFGMGRYVLQLEGLTLAAMRERFSSLLSDRDAVVARLCAITPELRNQVFLNGTAVADDYSLWKSDTVY